MALEKVLWGDVRELVKEVSNDFAAIIDELCPGTDHYLYTAEYPFGAKIIDYGVFHVADKENCLVPINHHTISAQVKDDLGYSDTVPLGLILENSIEAFMYSKERIIPSSFITAGKFISLWQVLDEGPSYHTGKFWNITSGARSICMVPKVTDSKCHKAINTAFKLKHDIPQKLIGHWEFFVKIANHRDFFQPWKSTILFFPKQWLAHKKDKQWSEFYRYLLNTVWQASNFRRNQFIFDFAFSSAQENRGLRPNPYLADIVRHLIAIASGAIPAFTPAIDSVAAPVHGLQRVYSEIYGIKKYAPVIVHAHHFFPEEQRVAYYSFQMSNNYAIFSPRSRKISTHMEDLQEIRHVMDVLISQILLGKLQIENTPLHWLAENIKFGFYHSEKDKSGEISLASEILNIDASFTKTLIDKNSYLFPDFAAFFKGCVTISAVK